MVDGRARSPDPLGPARRRAPGVGVVADGRVERRVRLLHVVAIVVGAIAFGLIIERVGWASTRDAIAGAGTWFVAIAAIDLCVVGCDAAGVYCFVRAEAPVGYARVFAAQASGTAINRLTPGNSLGEPIKVTMLLDHVPQTTAVSAIVKFNLATLYVAIVVIVVGVPLTLVTLDLPANVDLAVWLGTALIIAAALALAALLRRGALATLLRGAARLRLVSAARADRWIARTAAIDANIRSFRDPWSRRGIAWVLGSRALHCLGTLAVLAAAGITPSAPIVIGMFSVGILVNWVASIVPLGLGVADGTNYVLYGALGAAPVAGLVFTAVNRARNVVLAGLGLLVMMIANLVDRAGGDDA